MITIDGKDWENCPNPRCGSDNIEVLSNCVICKSCDSEETKEEWNIRGCRVCMEKDKEIQELKEQVGNLETALG